MTGPALSQSSVPTLKAVRDVLTDLLGREVHVAGGEPVALHPQRTSVAEYRNDFGAPVAVAVLDLPLAGALGGALGLLPPGGVEDMVDENDLSEAVIENLHEILNVLAGVFNAAGKTHLKLGALHRPGDEVSPEVAQLAATMGRRLDINIEVSRYGTGNLSLVQSWS
jgi:hypothetical protein